MLLQVGGFKIKTDGTMTEIMPPGHVQPLQRVSYKNQAKRKSNKDLMHRRGYDPMHALIDLYERLTAEDAYWCALRDGSLIKMTAEGPNVRYSGMAHQAILAQINKVHADLLKYGYLQLQPGTGDDAARSPITIELEGEEVMAVGGDADED